MIIYNVTVNIDDNIRDEWLRWMKDVHIPDVMRTGCFTEHRFLKLLVKEESGTSYSIQYSCKTMDDFNRYQKEFAPTLQQKHKEKFKDKFVAFRTLLEEV